MINVSKAQQERIKYRLENAKSLERSMFAGSFATYYFQDVSALLVEIKDLKEILEAAEDHIQSFSGIYGNPR